MSSSFIRREERWFLEDHTNSQGSMAGVIVEASHDSVRVTPFLRAELVKHVERETGRTLWGNLFLDTRNQVVIRMRDENGELVEKWREIHALSAGDVSGEYAEDLMLEILHAHVPEEWAKRFLPELVHRLRELGMNWKYEKVQE